MKGIVIITTESAPKREFANRLYEETGGKVDLVVIQRPPRKSFLKRVLGFVNKVGIFGLPKELFFVLRLLFSSEARAGSAWLGARTENTRYAGAWAMPTVVVESINTDEVERAIAKVSPQVIVIWGGMIVHEKILKLAPRAVNMHFGWCPYYRGANGNQQAILRADLAHVGITIHYAVKEVDAGEILAVVSADREKRGQELFKDLNDRGEKIYRDIAGKLLQGEPIKSHPQDLSLGRNYKLREWTYEKQYKLGKMLFSGGRA